jgi:hypothetical protein
MFEFHSRKLNSLIFGFTTGRQTTFVFNCKRRWPHAYVHRNKVMERPTGFNAEGPAEMYHLINTINTMVHGTPDTSLTYRNHHGQEFSYPVKTIYNSPPHGTADNHFSGDAIMDYAGSLGFRLTMTCRHEPRSLPSRLEAIRRTNARMYRSSQLALPTFLASIICHPANYQFIVANVESAQISIPGELSGTRLVLCISRLIGRWTMWII